MSEALVVSWRIASECKMESVKCKVGDGEVGVG